MNIKDENTTIGFEEIHIVKREDGDGFTLTAKGTFNGEPSTIEVLKMKQPRVALQQKNSSHEYLWTTLSHSFRSFSLDFSAELKPVEGTYFKATTDPVHYTKRQIESLKQEMDEVRQEYEGQLKDISDKIDNLKKLL